MRNVILIKRTVGILRHWPKEQENDDEEPPLLRNIYGELTKLVRQRSYYTNCDLGGGRCVLTLIFSFPGDCEFYSWWRFEVDHISSRYSWQIIIILMWKYFGCMIKLEIFMGVVRRYPSMMVADTRPSGYHILLMMLVLNWSQPTRQYGSLFELLWQHQRTWISLWMFSGSRFQYSLMMDESTRPLYIIIWRDCLLDDDFRNKAARRQNKS